MPWNKKLNLHFVHIPKNAGTSMRKYLDLEGWGHHEAWLELKNEGLDPMPSFCIYRDPVERFVSCYSYARMENSHWHGEHNPHPDYKKLKDANFSECIELLIAGKLKHEGWRPQHKWVYKDGRLWVDFCLDIKNLKEGLFNMFNELKLDFKNVDKLPRLNVSETASMSSSDISKVTDFYAKDYEVFKLKKV